LRHNDYHAQLNQNSDGNMSCNCCGFES